MKTIFTLLFVCLLSIEAFCQSEAIISPSNGTVASLEKNLLFYADKRFAVSQSGSVSIDLKRLFDGSMSPYYTSPINPQNPYVLLIENLPDYHSQRGGWIGWSSRYYQPKKFKIEVFDQWNSRWITIADVSNNANPYCIVPVPHVSVGKIKLTISETVQARHELGLSEVFYIHPEATSAYDKFLVNYDSEGKIKAREIRVEANSWPDYVFKSDYQLTTIEELESFISEHGHLPEIPKASVVESEGVELGEMNKLLLKKIEELTIHIIEQKKRIDESVLEIENLKKESKRNP